MVVKKSTARAAQGSQEKSFMPGEQLPPEHRSACCSWQLCFCKILDKLRQPVCRAEGGAKELSAARTP